MFSTLCKNIFPPWDIEHAYKCFLKDNAIPHFQVGAWHHRKRVKEWVEG